MTPPRRRCRTIARHLATVAFPWDTTRPRELALFRTFAATRIGGLRHGNGESRGVRRHATTTSIYWRAKSSSMVSVSTVRAARAIARINALYGRFRIANDVQ
jgi:hypothetical protein